MGIIKIMPCLDMKEGRVVKGIHFVDLKDAGDPVENAAFYQKEGADELAMLDIAATVENRKTRLEWVKSVSSVISIPLTMGGGISTLEDIEMVLDAGADKISMNSAAVKDPDLVHRATEKCGADRVTVAIDARRVPGIRIAHVVYKNVCSIGQAPSDCSGRRVSIRSTTSIRIFSASAPPPLGLLQSHNKAVGATGVGSAHSPRLSPSSSLPK